MTKNNDQKTRQQKEKEAQEHKEYIALTKAIINNPDNIIDPYGRGWEP